KRVLTVLAVTGKHDQGAENPRVTGDKLGLPLVTIHKSVLSVSTCRGVVCVGGGHSPWSGSWPRGVEVLAGTLLRLRHDSESWPSPAHSRGDTFGVDPVVVAPQLLRSVIYMLVWNSQHLEVDARPAFGEKLTDCRTEPARDDVL